MPVPSIRAVILVVDDEPRLKNLYEMRFRKQIAAGAYQFHYSFSGREALRVIETEPEIDMVLCDINMPEMDGLSLLPMLLELNPDLRVIMVSAYGDLRNIRKAMNLGAYDFVTKPIDFADLSATIDKTIKEVEIVKRSRISHELEEKNKSLRELDYLKSKLFTNISHEFRTPLTAILGTVSQIEEDPASWLSKGMSVIKRNGHRMLDLVNQILELRKLELGRSQLNLIQNDILTFIRYLAESFLSLAQKKQIRLFLKETENELIMDYDPDKFHTILSNLIANAIKFTPAEGTIEVSIDQADDHLQIKVSDSGDGIAPGEIPRVFDRFFQTKSSKASVGSGIGLALTKELIELMDGQILVESELGAGTSFTVLLPIRNEAEHREIEWITAPATEKATVSGLVPTEVLERPSLLIVEDNVDVAQYLRACLEEHYLIHIAWDGQEGIDYAIEKVPDLIISDVMMPVKDGFALCDTLKNDRRTSHIPIVLLTARADQESRIEGLEKGADAYLAKPFNQRELFVRLDKLLELRKKLQEQYSHLENLPGEGHNPADLESSFLWAVRQAIEENMDDEHFGISELCREVGASRSQMHNKIKALTNQSTSIFIRSIRLNKARELLMTTDLNVTQVAYEVGFKDSKYFSTTFHEMFGERPSKVRK